LETHTTRKRHTKYSRGHQRGGGPIRRRGDKREWGRSWRATASPEKKSNDLEKTHRMKKKKSVISRKAKDWGGKTEN